MSVRYYRPPAPVALDDPASVLAALLAEQPDATIAALEALLTSDEAVDPIALHLRGVDGGLDWRPYVREILTAACRSLRPKVPKEDG